MGEKIVIGPINRGLRTDKTAFNIDDDSFPVLINAYQWRSRIKRKRGTAVLGRLNRYFNSNISSYGSITTLAFVNNAANLLTGFGLESTGTIIPGSVTFTANVEVFTDPSENGTLTGSSGGTGTINYESGGVFVTGGAGNITLASFIYYPVLPVMGLEDLTLKVNQFPRNLGFDTKYSYNINPNFPYKIYDVSFYKNPSTGSAGYIPKANTAVTPTSWNGDDYQQFWTVNYEGAFWATNGIRIPFQAATGQISMQFLKASEISSATQTGVTTVDFVIPSTPLIVGDFVFANEFTGTSGSSLNFQTGYVTTINLGTNTYTVKFPNANIGAAGLTPGILQYLTTRSDATKDCIRWYDGDPTDGSTPPAALSGHKGWVNFCPPLSQENYSIAGLPPAKYYLVGARMIIPFKDRLLFFGPVVQTSADNTQVYLNDTVIYSQNGTPYYTCSFSGDPVSAATQFYQELVPDNQTASAAAYFTDQTGFGGFVSAGIDQALTLAVSNKDVLITGFERQQSRLVYSGDDILPFLFYTINTEYGSGSTFSGINTDAGVLSRGSRGFIITNENGTQRIDLPIPDQVFEMNLNDNGTERVCAQRDFISEWIYFSYKSNESTCKFPTQTLQYNYRDDTWAIFDECYTTYGQMRPTSGGFTWENIGETFPSWAEWNQPWKSGSSTQLQVKVIAGNQHGFVVFRNEGTGETESININFSTTVTMTGATNANPCVITAANQFVAGQRVTISGVVGMTQLNGNTYQITSSTPTTFKINVDSSGFGLYGGGGIATPSDFIYCPNNGLNDGDFIIITGCTGEMAEINKNIYRVGSPSDSGFVTSPSISIGTYFGGGLITRMYRPEIKSKQFPISWSSARKTRLGPQQYLLTTTAKSQITLLIYLSQNDESPYNVGNDANMYSTVLYTCPESENLGLTPANVNLNLVTAINQQQTWHRLNTSLIGDTVQIGFTLSDDQMFSLDSTSLPIVITGASKASQCVLTVNNNFEVGQMVKITGVIGMSELNFTPANNQYFIVMARSSTTVTIDVDSTAFSTYISGGKISVVAPLNQFAEIELHSCILDVSQSQILV